MRSFNPHAVASSFLVGFGLGGYGYYAWLNHNTVGAVVVGIGAAILFYVFVGSRAMSPRTKTRPRVGPLLTWFDWILLAAACVLTGVAVATTDWALLVSPGLFVAFVGAAVGLRHRPRE